MLIMQSVEGVYPLPRHVLDERHSDRSARSVDHLSSAAADGAARLTAQFLAVRVADENGIPQTVYRNADTSGWTHANAVDLASANVGAYITILPRRFF